MMAERWRHSKKLLLRAFWGVPVVVTVKDCLFFPKAIEGRSMQPTLNPETDQGRDWALVFKFGVLRYQYERGAIYIMRSPEHPRRLLVRRLIGIEGDWVTIPGELSLQRIEKGYCWVEGDNEIESEDSRTKFGQVPVSLIEGKIVGILWPPHRIGAVLASPLHERRLVTNSHAFEKN